MHRGFVCLHGAELDNSSERITANWDILFERLSKLGTTPFRRTMLFSVHGIPIQAGPIPKFDMLNARVMRLAVCAWARSLTTE